ncbi:MAG: extracellular solute-binding protein [Acidobacteriota bacterium]
MSVELLGISWNHTRGLLPLVATAQRFAETHPDVEIFWEKRSLQAFADRPLDDLAAQFDLLVIDHPFVGLAARKQTLLPLDELLPSHFLDDQAWHSVGRSHQSYHHGDHQWALAIDAAAPVSSWRPDLLEQWGVPLPGTWEELLRLARRGRVVVPAVPVDCLMNFFMLCSTLGEDPFTDSSVVVSPERGLEALRLLQELLSLCSTDCYSWNPIDVYEAMTSRDDVGYCPFAYGYSNYTRSGYAGHRLLFGELVTLDNDRRLRSTLGGTGLAISACCPHPKLAAEYVQYVTSPQCQRTIYFESGGQPGHRQAWLDQNVNVRSLNFFQDTLPVLDRAYLRPRYAGYLHFQDKAGGLVHQFLRDGGNPVSVLNQLNEIYKESHAS